MYVQVYSELENYSEWLFVDKDGNTSKAVDFKLLKIIDPLISVYSLPLFALFKEKEKVHLFFTGLLPDKKFFGHRAYYQMVLSSQNGLSDCQLALIHNLLNQELINPANLNPEMPELYAMIVENIKVEESNSKVNVIVNVNSINSELKKYFKQKIIPDRKYNPIKRGIVGDSKNNRTLLFQSLLLLHGKKISQNKIIALLTYGKSLSELQNNVTWGITTHSTVKGLTFLEDTFLQKEDKQFESVELKTVKPSEKEEIKDDKVIWKFSIAFLSYIVFCVIKKIKEKNKKGRLR